MSSITVIGGTGYAGSHIAAEAQRRGHHVIVASRSAHAPTEPVPDNVEYRAIDALDTAQLSVVIADSDVVVSALSPRAGLDGVIGDVNRKIADLVAQQGTTLLVVGGFSSLRREHGGPRVIDEGFGDNSGVPDDHLAALISEATQMNAILQDLLAREDDLDWAFFSPGMEFGSHVPGEPTGTYRVGTDGLVLTDANGRTAIGAADFALAVLDQLDSPTPHRGHLAVAY